MQDNQESEKAESLKRCGTLNPHPKKVVDKEFAANEFFDPQDLVQVKYEMLRRVQQQGQSVVETSRAFGFSRTSYYETRAAFDTGGLSGLLPKRPGPRRAHKLTDEVVDFVDQALNENPKAQASGLSELVNEHFGISVHPRSVERALERRKKKLRQAKGNP